ARVLRDDIGIDADRSAHLAAGRARRFERGLAALFRDEIERGRRRPTPGVPAWVRPDGHRQERKLALLAAVAHFGPDLVPELVRAAHGHLERGAAGNWCEWTLQQSEREDPA
ncbi:hypothetical protein KDM41_17450, partial [bacterium]|nr:hypothetical protein [bacterium]